MKVILVLTNDPNVKKFEDLVTAKKKVFQINVSEESQPENIMETISQKITNLIYDNK